MEQIGKKQAVLLAGLMMGLSAGTGLAADSSMAAGGEVQQKELEQAALTAGRAISRPLLHWDSVEKVRQAEQIKADSPEPLVVVHKAVPIIITAADIEAEEKAARRKAKDKPTVAAEAVTGQMSQPVAPDRPADIASAMKPEPAVKPAVPAGAPAVQPAIALSPAPAVVGEPSSAVVELPPIQAVAGPASPAASSAVTVELPPIQAVAASTSAKASETVELPPVQPVK